RLWMLRPAAIVLNNLPGESDQGSYNLSHPALAALYPRERRIILPPRYTICGGAALAEAFDYLAPRVPRTGRGVRLSCRRARALGPVRHDAHQLIEPVGQRGRSGLQDQRRLDLEQCA